MMPEPCGLVSLKLPGNMRIPSPAKYPAAAWLLFLAIALSVVGVTGCSDGPALEEGTPDSHQSQAATATQVSTPPITPVATPGYAPAADPTEAAESPISPQPPGPAPAVGFPAPPDRDFFKLARELLPSVGDIDPVVRRDPVPLEEGHRETLLLVDLEATELYESEFELRLVTPNAYWLIEDGLEVAEEDLERSAAEFEQTIYPLVTGAFGSEWKPGIDGDPRLYIINASLKGVGGYYSAADEYPKALRPVSNERESIYINSRYLPIGSDIYAQVLAHELQHAIHWNADRTEETWVNEGLSELAVTLAGYTDRSRYAFRQAGPTSLTIWPAGDVGGAENYGAASLFMHYLTWHYGGREDLRPLLAEAADGIPGIDDYLADAGLDVTFAQVFRDWAVANLLDEEEGLYGYSGLPASFHVNRRLRAGEELKSVIPQYATEYVRVGNPSEPATLVFNGDAATPLLPVDVGEGCWWSNRGDVIDSTLTTGIDLREVESATLDYQVWYSIEEDWDFAYLEVSEDGGEHLDHPRDAAHQQRRPSAGVLRPRIHRQQRRVAGRVGAAGPLGRSGDSGPIPVHHRCRHKRPRPVPQGPAGQRAWRRIGADGRMDPERLCLDQQPGPPGLLPPGGLRRRRRRAQSRPAGAAGRFEPWRVRAGARPRCLAHRRRRPVHGPCHPPERLLHPAP